MKTLIRHEISNTIATLQRLLADEPCITAISDIGSLCAAALAHGKKIMLVGNGGSAADAQHIAAEFVSRLAHDRSALAALALTTDTSCLTATGNDYGFDQVFARQVRALGQAGDVLIAISTSGRSPNVLEALKAALERGISTAGLTGASDSPMEDLCETLVRVPSTRTQNIQEAHILIGHTICAIAERDFLTAPGQPAIVPTESGH